MSSDRLDRAYDNGLVTRPDQAKLRRFWDKQAGSYDRQMSFTERRLLGQHRDWVCGQATGKVLEVAVGTGLNLPCYPPDVRLTGIDLSPAMLDIARRRAERIRRPIELHEGDAQALPFPDGSFDSVVCTFGLCSVPDAGRAVAEMKRVLRPGGRLLLLDHVVSSAWPIRAVQWLVERITVPLANEHFRRRPLHQVQAEGFQVEQRQRFRFGIVERLRARKAD